jgi:hypothetical protein
MTTPPTRTEFDSCEVPVYTITESEAGNGKVLDIRYKEKEGIVRCVSIGCDTNDVPFEKHVTYKFDWNMSRVAEELEAGARVSFTHIVTPRYEAQSSYIGTYLIGTTLTVDPDKARTVHPYLMGKSIQEELDYDLRITRTDESKHKTNVGYASFQLNNPSFAYMVEEEIKKLVDEWKCTQDCIHCDKCPCVWLKNREAMLTWDIATYDEEVEMKIRRKGIYRQMALIINDGPMGRGVRMQLPSCVVDGVRSLFPDPNAKYMGHKDE